MGLPPTIGLQIHPSLAFPLGSLYFHNVTIKLNIQFTNHCHQWWHTILTSTESLSSLLDSNDPFTTVRDSIILHPAISSLITSRQDLNKPSSPNIQSSPIPAFTKSTICLNYGQPPARLQAAGAAALKLDRIIISCSPNQPNQPITTTTWSTTTTPFTLYSCWSICCSVAGGEKSPRPRPPQPR